MRELLETLMEELPELIYISDPHTYELLYLNEAGRRTFGELSPDGSSRCHRVLQGLEEPCPFCTNDVLGHESFYSWEITNPLTNRHYLLRDKLITWRGRESRIEIAFDLTEKEEERARFAYLATAGETVVECIKRLSENEDTLAAINGALALMGGVLDADRTYVFAIHEDRMNNIAEWCAPGVPSQRELLQREPLASIDWWIQSFNQGQVVQIPDVEALRLSHPAAYATLQSQGVRDLAAGPIYAEKQLVGFLGVDNPGQEMSALVPTLMKSVGPFVAALLKRRQLVQHLHELSFRDPLTGVLNRHALAEYRKAPLQMHAVGVLSCDIVDLKALNDSDGEAEGDRLVRRCCQLMREAVETELVFRTDGDKFVALRPECSREDFHRRAEVMRRRIREELHPVAVVALYGGSMVCLAAFLRHLP